MQILAGLSVGLLVLTALIVVIRTFALWSRTRGLPELLLSIYLTGATVLGYPLLITSSRIPPDVLWPLHLSGLVTTSIGFTSLLLFTRKVFRPDALWARLAVGICCLTWATNGVIYFLQLTGENPRPAAELIGINIANTMPIAFAYFWTTVESLTYHRRLRRRLGLGLVEIAVVNRVLLWGLMTLSAGVATLISMVGILMGSFMSLSLLFVLSVLGIAHASCLFLAFHPPGWYTAWLERWAAAEGR